MSVKEAQRNRRYAWQEAATHPSFRMVLMELCGDFAKSPPPMTNLNDFERGRFEGSRDKAIAIVRELVLADKAAGVRFIADLLEGSELWERKTQKQRERRDRRGERTEAPSRAETPEPEDEDRET